MPRSRASEARCEVEPPSSATTPATRGRMWLSAGPATRVTRMSPGATRASSHSQLTTTARPEPQPMPAGWPLRPGCCSQISSGTMRRLHVQRPRLQQLEAGIVERPFDLDRHAEHVFGLAQQAPERRRLAGVEAGRADQLFRHRLRQRAGAVHAGLAVILAAGLDACAGSPGG